METKEEKKFRLLDYWFNNVSLKFEKTLLTKEKTKELSFKDALKRTIKKVNNNIAIVALSFSLNAGEQSPVSLNIELCGRFECTDWETDDVSKVLIKDNAAAILFPYLRHCVSEMTTMAGLPPLVLPITNVAQLFDKK